MIFTVEPWYYNHDKNIAVFTEDVILVTKTGAENLTAALPRGPEELERLMGTQ
jgi:Xaa-Pro aminopeptidase